MFFIETERLKLIPLTHQLLQLSYTDRPALEHSLGLNTSVLQIDPYYMNEYLDALVNYWLPKTLEHPYDYQWFTNWEIILKSENIAIGGMGCGGDNYPEGEAETGYALDVRHQNKGYATEALAAIIKWAFKNDTLKSIKAQTYSDNLPSVKVLIKNGFKLVDDVGGLLTYRLERPGWGL